VAPSQGTEAVYALHSRWLNQVLGPGDSLFTPGAAIWTGEHLEELERAFAGHPDTTAGKRYEEKLRGQLAGVSPGAKQLMAEIHAVHIPDDLDRRDLRGDQARYHQHDPRVDAVSAGGTRRRR
jgi:hypothetical protein